MVDTIVKVLSSDKFTIPEGVEKLVYVKNGEHFSTEKVEKQVENTSRNAEVRRV